MLNCYDLHTKNYHSHLLLIKKNKTMKKLFVFIKKFFSSILEETEVERKQRQDIEDLRRECENFRYSKPLLTDKQLQNLRERVMTQKINEYAGLVQIPPVNPHFPFDSLNIFSNIIHRENDDNSWNKYCEEISTEIESRKMY